MTNPTTSAEFFEQMYRENADPWQFATSKYELFRYQTILAQLRGRRYVRAFEPGCSIGVLTVGLAQLCDQVEAADISEGAVTKARQRCSGLGNVSITRCSLTEQIPNGPFDLVVFSEIGYYFDRFTLKQIVETLASRLMSEGIFLSAHWLGFSQDHVLSGDEVHRVLTEAIHKQGGLELLNANRYQDFRLDRWRKRK